jgi:arylsulfatase A-like enzyme
MRHPETFPAGTVSDALASHLDLVPTVMDLLGLPSPSDVHGLSLKALASTPSLEIREDAFAEVNVHAAAEPMRSVRTRRYAYIRIFETDLSPVLPNIDTSPSKDLWMTKGFAGRLRERVQLYDLVFDPQERRNVAGDPAYAEALREMENRLERWMRETRDPLLDGKLAIPVGAKLNPRGGVSPHEELTELREPLVVD